MFENGLLIKYGKTNILAEHINIRDYSNGSNFTVNWIFTDKKPNKMYCINKYSFNLFSSENLKEELKNKGYELIILSDMIKEKLVEILNDELDKKLKDYVYDGFISNAENNSHISYDNYIYKHTNFPYIRQIDKFGEDIRSKSSNNPEFELSYKRLLDGLIDVKCKCSENPLSFNLETSEFVNSKDEILFSVYNKTDIDLMRGYELYNKDLMPAFYNQVVYLKSILRDKSKITVELKNGSIYKTNANLHNIFMFNDDGKVYIRDSYDNQLIKGKLPKYKEYTADQILKFKYRKDEFYIKGSTLDLSHFNKETIFDNTKFEGNIYQENRKVIVSLNPKSVSFPESFNIYDKNLLDKLSKYSYNIYLNYSPNKDETEILIEYINDNEQDKKIYKYKPNNKEYEVLQNKINDFSIQKYNKNIETFLSEIKNELSLNQYNEHTKNVMEEKINEIEEEFEV